MWMRKKIQFFETTLDTRLIINVDYLYGENIWNKVK